MKKYWIMSQLFHPNETSTGFVMTKIAEEITNIGEVNVICGTEDYHSKTFSNKETLDERIKIHRVKSPNWDKNNLSSRILSFIYLTVGFAWKASFKIKKHDTLILVTNPPTLIIFISILKKLKGFKLIVILQDIFPENLVAAGLSKKSFLTYRILVKLFNYAFNKSDHLIACGNDMRDLFQSKVKSSVPISVITNWADHEEIFPIAIDSVTYFGISVKNKVIIEFAGNIGRVQGLERFIDAFSKADNPELILLIIGDGAFKNRLEELKIKNNLNSVLFLPSKPRSEQNNFLNACDIGLVTLNEGMYGLGVPSKAYNILAAGKPILYIGDRNSEIYNYVENFDTGWAFTWKQQEKLIDFLENIKFSSKEEIQEKGKNSRLLVEKKFTKEFILDKYNKIFQ